MYERMRTEIMEQLSYYGYAGEDLDRIITCVDKVANNYDVESKKCEIVTYSDQDGLPYQAKTFLVSKGIEGYSKGTLKNYKYHLQNFFFAVTKPVEQISVNDVRIFLYEYQREHGVSNASLERIRIALNTFFTWCVNEEYIIKNPVSGVQKIKVEKKQKKALTPLSLEYLREGCTTLREKAMIEFMYSTGCRVGELVILTLDDINWNTREVHLFGKGKKHRTSFINAKAEVALKAYLADRKGDSEILFTSERLPYGALTVAGAEKIIRQIGARCDGKLNTKVTPHVLRHTTATTALHNGMPVEEIKELLGHTNINTTMIYAEVNKTMVKASHERCVI